MEEHVLECRTLDPDSVPSYTVESIKENVAVFLFFKGHLFHEGRKRSYEKSFQRRSMKCHLRLYYRRASGYFQNA